MSKVGYDLYRRRLHKLLSEADEEGFTTLCWAVDGLQSLVPHRIEVARRVIHHSQDVVVSAPTAQNFVHKWMLEALYNELLLAPKPRGKRRQLNHSHFDGIVPVYNALRSMENEEYGWKCEPENVMREMARIAHRQFEWQRGVFSLVNLARSLELYSGPLSQEYFLEQRRFSISTFILGGYAIYAILLNDSGFTLPKSAEELGLTEADFEAVVGAISLSAEEARAEARRLRASDRNLTAYRKSVLRLHPIVSFGAAARYRAPLMELVWLRVTTGIFYDVVSAPGRVANEISNRFEAYCTDLLSHAVPELTWMREEVYNYRGPKKTPDIRAIENGTSKIVFECKSQKMDIVARFAANPVAEAPRGFDDIANGIRQVWRYLSHARRGFIPNASVACDTFGVVLTLDPWMRMASGRYADLLAKAHELADAEDGIEHADRCKVSIVSVDDLEDLCRIASSESLKSVLSAAAEPRYSGYLLTSLHDELGLQPIEPRRENPFIERIGGHLPWWDTIEDRRLQRDGLGLGDVVAT